MLLARCHCHWWLGGCSPGALPPSGCIRDSSSWSWRPLHPMKALPCGRCIPRGFGTLLLVGVPALPGGWTAQDSEGLFRCTVFSQLDLVSFCSAHNPDLLTETSLSGCKLHQIKRPNPYCKPRSCPTYITRESLAVAVSRGQKWGPSLQAKPLALCRRPLPRSSWRNNLSQKFHQSGSGS